MNATEKRKLERRIPLWEDSLKVANAIEYKELMNKINKARKQLGLHKYVASEVAPKGIEEGYGSFKNNSKLEIAELKKLKLQAAKTDFVFDSMANRKSREELLKFAKAIVQLKNEYGLNDSEIALKLNVSHNYVYIVKKRHINVKYKEKIKDYITPESYCDMRNDGYSEDEIARHYGITFEMVKKFRNERTRFIYKIKEGIKLKGKNNERVLSIIERYNNGEKFCDIGEDLGIKQSVLSTMVGRKAYRYYVPCENKSNKHQLTPEKYIKLKELGYKDGQIIKEYGIGSATLTVMKREKIESYYELKNKEENVWLKNTFVLRLL